MKISVVVPTLNAGKFLFWNLHGILQQTTETEVILVDGGSTDDTLETAKSYQEIMPLEIVNREPRGEPDAINTGLLQATGDILAWLDADDEYHPGCFEAVNYFFKTHPGALWAYGRCRIIDSDGIEKRKWLTAAKELGGYSRIKLLIGDFIAQPAVFFRRDAINKAGLLNTKEKLAFDYDYWLRLAQYSPPGFINQNLANWRSHPESETARDLLRDMKDGLRLAKQYSPDKWWLRPAQYGVYWSSVAAYKLSGALK